jgi:hypothetical protein
MTTVEERKYFNSNRLFIYYCLYYYPLNGRSDKYVRKIFLIVLVVFIMIKLTNKNA